MKVKNFNEMRKDVCLHMIYFDQRNIQCERKYVFANEVPTSNDPKSPGPLVKKRWQIILFLFFNS